MINHRSSEQIGIRARHLRLAAGVATLTLSLLGCSKAPDSLRTGVPATGIAATVQVNLPIGSQQAQVTGTVYRNAVAQPLVGGDVLQAKTDQSLTTLHSIENLSGNYAGLLFVDHPATTVDVAVNYDQKASAEDRWFGSDNLLVNPGPGSLVGYSVPGMTFPQEVFFASPVANTKYVTPADIITVNWTPVNEGNQMRLSEAVACVSQGQTYRYGLVQTLGIEGQDAGAAGSYSLSVGALVGGTQVAVTLTNVAEYIALVSTAVYLGLEPQQLVNGSALIGTIERCDIDLTLFRESNNPLPASFSGGYAITSRSDTVRIQYAP